MRAVRIHEWAAPAVVEEVPDPARAAGETLVRIDAAAINHLDLTVASGTFELKPALPYVGGVEGSATVLESDDIPVGTQVLLRGGGLGLLRDGTWRESASVPTKAMIVLDTALAPEVAATFFVPATTAYVAVHDIARVQPGERVAVIGASGGVGSMLVQVAGAVGAQVTGISVRADQLDEIPDAASRAALSDADASAEFASKRSFDLIIDTVGGADLIARTRWVRPGGRAVAVGYVAGVETTVHLPSWLLDDVALLPVNMIRQEKRSRQIAPELAARIGAGELRVPVETVAVEAAPDALSRLATGRVHGRAAIVF
jgi:NADPH:quinone reductase